MIEEVVNFGSGKIQYFLFVPKSAINTDVYTQLDIMVEAARKEDSFSKKYEKKIQQVKEKIEGIADKRKEARYEEVTQSAKEEIQEAQTQLQEEEQKAKQQLQEAKEKLDQARKQLKQNEEKVGKGEKELEQNEKEAKEKFKQAEKQLKQGAEELSKQEETFFSQKKAIEEQIQQAKIGLQQLVDGISKIEETIASLEQKKQELESLGQDTTQIEMAIKQAKMEKSNLEEKQKTVESQIKVAQMGLVQGETKIQQAKQELAKQEQQFTKTKQQTQSQFGKAKQQLREGKEEIQKAKQELEQGEKQLEQKQKEAEEQIQEAKNEIQEAKDKVNQLKRPDWYVLDRQSNIGYVSYSQDTDRLSNIAKVFPVVFFVVAALISLTSMTRMVEEQRTQIGTLKALGYTKLQIAKKYILYATSATVIGGLIGVGIGFLILPKIIFNMYAMMYTVPEIILEFNWIYLGIGMLCALACTVGATIFSCSKELSSTPAMLMRPKAPKQGKRVLLERIPFIWSRLKFTHKVTVRNIFRYKKRFLMTIVGIMGCTSLIVAGFALRDAVSNMIPSQYGEVFSYQASISFKEEAKREEIQTEKERLEKIEKVTSALKVNMQSIEILEKNNAQSIQLIVPEKADKIDEYIHLFNRKTKETYSLNEDGILITEKLAKLLDIKIGDMILIENREEQVAKVKVTGITANYLMHYVYMTPELYQVLYGEDIKYNTILAKTKDVTEQQEEELGKQILENNEVSSVDFTSNTKNIFAEVMDNMTFVVWILIVSAGLLAFVVLYNLSNVNISERIRELATIKVLGFYDKEVYRYVARETVILTIIGILLGLVGGYILNMFIIKTCELDTLMFDPRVSPLTYLYGILITLFFTAIVNLVTYFSLKKINMIDSLKSVE